MIENVAQLQDAFTLSAYKSKRIELYDSFAACLKGSSPIHDTLDELAELAREKGHMSKMRVLAALSNEVRTTQDLAQGLGNLADTDDKMVLAISPTSSNLSALLASVSQMAKMRLLISKAAFNVALYYGLFLTVAGVIAYVSSGISLIPDLLGQLPLAVHPFLSTTQVTISKALVAWWPVATFAVVSCVIFIIWSLPRLTGRARDVLDKFPIYASYKAMAAGNFLVTLAILYKNQVATIAALDTIRDKASPYIAYQVQKMFERGSESSSSDELALLDTGFVDEDLLALIRVIAKKLSPSEAVAQIALGQTDQLLSKVRNSSSFASSMLLFVGGALVILTLLGSLGLAPLMMQNLSAPGQR